MTFFIDLFDYLMSNHETEISELFEDIFKQICNHVNIDSITLLFILNETSTTYECTNYFSHHSSILDTGKVNISKNTHFNEIISSENTNDYYSEIEIVNEKFILHFCKNGTMDLEHDYNDCIIFIKNMFYYKSKVSYIDKKKMNFIMNMSHEVRTPLNAIITMSELILQNKTEKCDLNKMLYVIKLAGIDLLQVVNNILDYSKVLTNRMKLKYNPLSLHKTINTLFALLGAILKNSQCNISYEIDSTIPDIILSDNTRIKQLLLSILQKTIKSVDNGYVKLVLENVDSTDYQCQILFKIIDSVPDKNPDEHDKVFHFFHQIDTDYLLDDVDMGIDLVIAKHIVTLLKGKIWIEPNEPEGSIMNILINFAKFKNDIEINQIQEHFTNCQVLLLSSSATERVEFLKIFRQLGINSVSGSTMEEINEYILSHEKNNMLFVSDNDLIEENIQHINDLNPSILKILVENTGTKSNLIFDYKMVGNITQEKIVEILSIVCTIENHDMKNSENEIFSEIEPILPTENIIDHSNIKILVVEDNIQNQDCMEKILKFKELSNIDKAFNGVEAIEKMNNNIYDLVLMDIRMPGLNGIEVTKQFKINFPSSNTIIIAVTAGVSDEIKETCSKIGMNGFLSKPIDVNIFSNLIDSILLNKK